MSGIAIEEPDVGSEEKKQVSPLGVLSKPAEEKNTAEQNYRKGFGYYMGEDVSDRDNFRAIAFFRKAADQGHPEAQYLLGRMHYRNEGVIGSKSQRNAKAVKWFRKAAAQGHASALFSLGAMYERNEGVASEKLDDAERYKQAAKYYCLADRQGHKDAKGNLTRLERRCDEHPWSTTWEIWGWTGLWRRWSVPSEIAVEALSSMAHRNPSDEVLQQVVMRRLADPRASYLAPCISEEELKAAFSRPIPSMARPRPSRQSKIDPTPPSSSIKPPSKSLSRYNDKQNP